MKYNDITQPTIKKLLENHPAQMKEKVKLHRDQVIIYIINLGANHYKIGQSRNLAERYRSFQASNPFLIDDKNLIAALVPAALQNRKTTALAEWAGGPHGAECELHHWCIEEEYNYESLKNNGVAGTIRDGVKQRHSGYITRSALRSEIFTIPPRAFKKLFNKIESMDSILLSREQINDIFYDVPAREPMARKKHKIIDRRHKFMKDKEFIKIRNANGLRIQEDKRDAWSRSSPRNKALTTPIPYGSDMTVDGLTKLYRRLGRKHLIGACGAKNE
tara:strand:- start:56 stop:880 length:825 start_codon:yes stop_codon:yes gene_type:complete